MLPLKATKPISNTCARSDIIRSQQLQQKAVKSLDDLAAELASLRSGLEKTTDELREYKSQQAEQRKADHAQAVIDKMKDRRDQFLVAAFTVAFTLFLEHFCDVVKFAKFALESVRALFL